MNRIRKRKQSNQVDTIKIVKSEMQTNIPHDGKLQKASQTYPIDILVTEQQQEQQNKTKQRLGTKTTKQPSTVQYK
jgi:hypothetical protein